ncbi:MAG TPA: FHA domain-containing protein [Phycisphaerae bacterium]|nr:FHA domain-containing protein [Phycisphaerae bacterium]HRR86223.1 FHA domain-containing protein [Phycisphaerae bacterium]
MVSYSTPPEAIDERFIEILIEELGPKGPRLPAGEDDQTLPIPPKPASHDDELLPLPLEPLEDTVLDHPPLPQEVPAAAPLVLRIVEPGEPDQVVKLAGNAIGIGRSRINTVVVRCPRVSRKHLRVWMEAGAVWVEEMTGNHIMSVNGVRMPRARLQLNDEVQVGSVKLFVESQESGESQ